MKTGGHSVNDFRIMGIVQLENPPRSKADLKKRLIEFEGYWQIKLQTIELYGMNTVLECLEAIKRGEGRSFLLGLISGNSRSWAQIEWTRHRPCLPWPHFQVSLQGKGMVPADGKGMAFKVRHGLLFGKGQGLLVQAGSL